MTPRAAPSPRTCWVTAWRRGVDLEDDEQLAGYMHWYNSLPDEERVELSDTGRLPAPTVAFDREEEMQAARTDSTVSGTWPWFLPALDEDDGIALEDMVPGDDHAVYAGNAFVRRAAALLDLLGDGDRPVTATGALNRADCIVLLEGEHAGTAPAVRTMWERTRARRSLGHPAGRRLARGHRLPGAPSAGTRALRRP